MVEQMESNELTQQQISLLMRNRDHFYRKWYQPSIV